MFCLQMSVSAQVQSVLSKRDEMCLCWVFTIKTAVILLKISLNLGLIGLDQLYTGRNGRSSRGKV